MIDRVTNVEQLSTMMSQYQQDIQQTQQQIALVQNNIQQYQNMIQNTLSLPSNLIDSLKSSLGSLAKNSVDLNIMKGDYMAMGQIFDTLYPGLDIIKNLANGQSDLSPAKIWEMWSKEADRATQATFQLTAMQLKDLAENSTALDNHINQLLSSPEGQMQAISAGNNLAAIQIAEAQKLRGLMATSIQSASQNNAKSEKKEQYAAEKWRQFSGKSDTLSNLIKE
jgi:P-type conjugative transfer protein TrbJ